MLAMAPEKFFQQAVNVSYSGLLRFFSRSLFLGVYLAQFSKV